MKISRPVAVMLLALGAAGTAQAQADWNMPAVGGFGGAPFVARCEPGDILNGFELQTGDDVDSIRPICARPNTRSSIGQRHAFSRKFGGDGGTPLQLVCPDQAPAIAGVSIGGEGVHTMIVNDVELFCSDVYPNEPLGQTPTVRFNGPVAEGSTLGRSASSIHRMQTCPAGMVPVGISGRYGQWLDAFGLICGAYPLGHVPAKSIGRVDTGSDAAQRSQRPICEVAEEARVRNSPAASGLEAQCQATKTGPEKTIGRVSTGTGAPLPQRSVCDAAVDARARNSPAAAGLEAQCQAAGGIYKMRPSDADFEVVRARGEAIAALDPGAGNVRASLYEAPRRGFDVGLGVWDGNTEPGPGKQRYRDFLTFPEQGGFDIAASYALPRNKYARYVDVARAINAADVAVRNARNSKQDGFYWLGFDIASGIFGDPRAGAQGNTALGPGSLTVRASLNAAGQSGFDASVKLHFSRKYR
jgi:hypothetical protein